MSGRVGDRDQGTPLRPPHDGAGDVEPRRGHVAPGDDELRRRIEAFVERVDSAVQAVARDVPSGNRHVWRQWTEAIGILGGVEGVMLGSLEAEMERNEPADKYR